MEKLELPIYTLEGTSNRNMKLDPAVFDCPAHPTLIAQAVAAADASSRWPIASTKDRGRVAGSGKKPWRQKGTGRARAGSVRSPLWRGGGITFGPTADRNYRQRLPLKMKRGAWRGVLTDRLAHHGLTIIDSFAPLDGKTKSWMTAVACLTPVAQLPKGALLLDQPASPAAARSLKNMPKHRYAAVNGVTIGDIVDSSHLVLSVAAIEALQERLGQTDGSRTIKTKAAS